MHLRLVVAAAMGIALVAWGLYAVVAAASGDTGGTDTSPGFGYVIGVPALAVGLVAVGLAVAAARRRR